MKEDNVAHQRIVNLSSEAVADELDELQPGTRLLQGQYTITRYLNSGGFGITYLANDSLDRTVVIKECFLSTFCRRSNNVVLASSAAYQADLKSVVRLFIGEAQNLARLAHPNIVSVHQVFEDNGTAYMALDYIEGRDLLQIIEDEPAKFSPDEVVRITEKLLSAVKYIHESGMLHRDISPDNVLISRTCEPILIDFGAAREQASRKSRALSAMHIVKDGYSPQEFYIAGSEQGPFSDLYALGATLHHLIAGEAPPNSQLRLTAIAEGRPDLYTPLAGRFTGYPKGFLEAIDAALKCFPKERVKSASEWLDFFRTSGVLPIFPQRHGIALPQPQVTVTGALAEVTLAVSEDSAGIAAVSSPKKHGGMLLGGLIAATVAAGLAFVLISGNEEAVVEAAAAVALPVETAATQAEVEPVAVAAALKPAEAAVVAKPDPAAPAVTEEPAAEARTAAVEAPVAVEVPVEVAAPAVVEAPVEVAAPLVPVAEQQITFAAWDVRMPFFDASRIVLGQQTLVVSRINPAADLAVAGNWLQPGLTITAVNDKPVTPGSSVAGLVLDSLTVDPDGYARTVVRYSDLTGQKQTGLLAVQTVRLVNLANGISFVTGFEDGGWLTRVASVKEGAATTLLVGDIIFRDKFTGTAIDGPQSLEGVMPAHIERELGTVEFAVIRESKLESAYMQLVIASAAAVAE